MIDETKDLSQFILKNGKHASSLITLLPHFKSYWSNQALIRYFENSKIIWGAHGPLNGNDQTVVSFFNFAKTENKLAILSPTDKLLADELKMKKYFVTPIGVTPLFVLKDYFEKTDPLNYFPLARALKRKGAVVHYIKGENCPHELKEKFANLINIWEERQNLSFLCKTKPMENFESKIFIYLKDKEDITALVSALYYDNDKIYLCDYIRSNNARAGSIEYTLIEGMRELEKIGVKEVSLGLCPLAQVNRPWWVQIIFKNNLFYNFKGLYHFKKKLKPTRFETQYLVCSKNLSPFDYKNIAELILDQKISNLIKNKMLNIFIMREEWCGHQDNRPFLHRVSLTLSFSAIFIALHYLRHFFPALEYLFSQSAYLPANVTNLGIWLSPFFHYDQFHLWGDQLSLIFLGCTLEYLIGKKITFVTIALGLWLSNPLAVSILKPILQFFPTSLAYLMQEVDYGSSNAVYALAGALSGVLQTRNRLLLPFIANAILLLFMKESLLAVHHLTGLFMGLILTLFLLPIPNNKFLNIFKLKAS